MSWVDAIWRNESHPVCLMTRKRFVPALLRVGASLWAWPQPAPSHQGIFEAFYCCVQCVEVKWFILMSSSGFVDTELLLIVFAPCDSALYQSWHIWWDMDGNCPSLIHGGIHLWGSNSGCLHFNLALCFCITSSLPVISNSSVKRFEGNLNWQGKMDFECFCWRRRPHPSCFLFDCTPPPPPSSASKPTEATAHSK